MRVFSGDVHLTCTCAYVCENLVAASEQGMTSPCHPAGTQTLLWRGRKDSVCVILPLYLTAIFHCPVTFTSSLPSRQVSSSPCNALPPLLSATDPPDSTQPWPNLTITMLNHLSASQRRFRLHSILFLKHVFMTSNHSHVLPRWPQPPVQTLNHTHVLVELDPQTQTVNFCLAQKHQIANVSINFRFQSDFVKECFLVLRKSLNP